MSLNEILNGLFPAGHTIVQNGHLINGEAQTRNGAVAMLGTTDAAAINHDIALSLAAGILEVVERQPGRPIVFLVDTKGQALSRAEELLCLNGSFAHLARCVDLARRQGHVSLSIVTGEAVSGGFLSFGLMADKTYALANAQVRVMDLRAMSRVTKLPLERLTSLAGSSPTFAPGAENYLRMGAIEGIWDKVSSDLLDGALEQLQQATQGVDQRMAIGSKRGGRQLAQKIVDAVLAA
jgi:malonate decarboxylase gamma subunit